MVKLSDSALKSSERSPPSKKRREMREARRKAQSEPFSGPAKRCTGCGGRVQLPCHACRIRRALRAVGLSVSFDGPGEPLGVELDESSTLVRLRRKQDRID